MHAIRGLVGTALAVIALSATPAGASRSPAAAQYSVAVSRICAGALLFDHAHHMGTRSDAIAVARDIRLSTARRLSRVAALAVPPDLKSTSRRWIATERGLAEMYARAWVRIYDTIDAASTPALQATLARRLERLVHAPDRLRRTAGRLELELGVPDCTGGG